MPQLSTGDGFPDVVVTGIAMTTALATDADNTWKKLLDGQSAIRKLDDPFIERFDLPVRIGGHLLEDFDHELARVELHRYLFCRRCRPGLADGSGRTPARPRSTPTG
jgi:beta-ketoacyl ACP synthase